MGLTTSKEEKEKTKLDNIKKLFNNNDKTDDILDTLNLTEFKKDNNTIVQKKSIPLVGGYDNNFDKNDYTNDKENDYKKDFTKNNDDNLRNKRYTKYDLFKILRDIDSEFQKGGQNDNTDINDNNSSLNDEKSLEHIKNIILKELDNLKNNKAPQLGGNGCGCDSTKSKNISMKNVEVEQKLQNGGAIIIDNPSSSSTSSSTSESSSSEIGKKTKTKGKKVITKKSKANKKANKKINKSLSEDDDSDDNSSKFFIETSESGINKFTSNDDLSENGKKKRKSKKSKLNKNKNVNTENKSSEYKLNEDKSNENNQNEDSEGLSIFPFNSSDVKSSLSVKNYRMLRRKI
jgi:hypothetical protein